MNEMPGIDERGSGVAAESDSGRAPHLSAGPMRSLADRMSALCRREWLEHRGGFFWAPAITAAIIAGAMALALIVGQAGAVHIDLDWSDFEGYESMGKVQITGEDLDLSALMDGLLAGHEWSDAEIARHLRAIRFTAAEPFYFLYVIVLGLVLVGALFEDRKDRSVLFWKSIPVTDVETVVSKLITAVWIAPAAAVAMIVAVQLLLVIVISGLLIGSETLGPWRIWANSGLVIGLIELCLGFAVQGLWMLPLSGWLLLVSAASNRAPSLWALFSPLALMLLESVIGASAVVRVFVVDHLKFRALPRATDSDGGALQETVGLLATFDLWLGVAIGAAFLAGAVQLRRRRNEI